MGGEEILQSCRLSTVIMQREHKAKVHSRAFDPPTVHYKKPTPCLDEIWGKDANSSALGSLVTPRKNTTESGRPNGQLSIV